MKNPKHNFSEKLFRVLFFLLLPCLIVNAQSAKNELSEKIKNIKGDIEKITITAGGEEYTFTDEEAEELFKKLKAMNSKKFMVKVIDDVDDAKTVWITKGEDDVNVEVKRSVAKLCTKQAFMKSILLIGQISFFWLCYVELPAQKCMLFGQANRMILKVQ